MGLLCRALIFLEDSHPLSWLITIHRAGTIPAAQSTPSETVYYCPLCTCLGQEALWPSFVVPLPNFCLLHHKGFTNVSWIHEWIRKWMKEKAGHNGQWMGIIRDRLVETRNLCDTLKGVYCMTWKRRGAQTRLVMRSAQTEGRSGCRGDDGKKGRH